MADPHLWLKGELGPVVEGALGATVGLPWSTFIPRNSPVAGQDTLPNGQGFRVRTEQGMGFVWAPAPASH